MSTRQPLRTEVCLSNRVVELVGHRHPNELEVRRCESGIRRLLERPNPDTDFARCYLALGLIRIIRGDGKGALDAIRNARQLKSADRGTAINVLIALQNLGEIREASALADEWRSAADGDRRLLLALCAAYKGAYRVDDALGALREIQALKPDGLLIDERLTEATMIGSKEKRAAEGYSFGDLQERFCFAIDVMRREGGAFLLRHSHWSLPDGSALHSFFVDASPDRCAELDWLIIDRMVERFDRAGGEVLSFRCLPVDAYFDIFHRRAAAELVQ